MSGIPIECSAMFEPKKNERLDNVIEKLKDHIGFVQNSDEDVNEVTIFDTLKNGKTEGATNASDNIPSGDNALTKSYLMWQNNANVCWLDASMALLVHNRTLIQSVNESSTTQISNIIKNYYKAVSILNDCSGSKLIDERVKDAKDMLKKVQESALKYLQPILKYKEGEPDSAFCSLLNLIVEEKSVKDIFELEYTWAQMCQECKAHRAKKHRKPIVTLPRVEGFQPSSPISLYQCLVCKALDQRMTLSFRTLPQCLLFHFESGAGKGELQYCSFKVDGRTYKMTGVMIHEKGKESNSNHFVTFIRDPSSDMWMECNDLCEDVTSFTVVPPFIDLQDVYILMFEALDGNGTVPNCSLSKDQEEELSNESVDIPIIDLEDEEEEDKTETSIKEDKEFKENMDRVGKVDRSGGDGEKGSGKDVVENACLIENDSRVISCENVNSLEKNPVNVSSDGIFEDICLVGTDCEDDSTKVLCEEESHKSKVYVKGLFEKFNLESKDNSSQEFSKGNHKGSTNDAGDEANMSGSDDTPQSESNNASLGEITSSCSTVMNHSANFSSQLQINSLENTNLQSKSRKKLTASVSLDKDIFTPKNNLASLDDIVNAPKDIQPNTDCAFIATCGTDGSDSSKTLRGLKKKLVEKEKPVSHHQKTQLESEKMTNKMLDNIHVPKRSKTHVSSIQLNNTENASLEVALKKASESLTDCESEMPVVKQCKAKLFSKSRKRKIGNSLKVENNSSETEDNLQDHALKKSCNAPGTASDCFQNLYAFKKKKFVGQTKNRDLKTLNNQPSKELIHKESNAKTFSKNKKHGSVEIDIDIPDQVIKTYGVTFETIESSTRNHLIRKQTEGKLTKTNSNHSNKQKVAMMKKTKNKKDKSIDNSTSGGSTSKSDNDLHEHSIAISEVKSMIESLSKSENFDAIEEQLQIQADYPSNNLNACDPFDVTLIAKKNKAKSLSQNKNRSNSQRICQNKKVLNRLEDEKNSTENVVVQEKSFDSSSIETTNESVKPSQTAGVMIKKNTRLKSKLKINDLSVDLNPSNNKSNMPFAAEKSKSFSKNRKHNIATNEKVNPSLTAGVIGTNKTRRKSQSKISDLSVDFISLNDKSNMSFAAEKTKSFLKNRKRKCVDGFKVDPTKVDNKLKKPRYQLRSVNAASRLQNGTDLVMKMNKTSHCNDSDHSEKYLLCDNTKSNVNEPSSSKYDNGHGPGCLCDGTKRTADVIDIIIGRVLKGLFIFTGIKEKK